MFKLAKGSFHLTFVQADGRHAQVKDFESFLDEVCAPTLASARSAKRDEKGRLVLVFVVRTAELPAEPVSRFEQDTAAALARSLEVPAAPLPDAPTPVLSATESAPSTCLPAAVPPPPPAPDAPTSIAAPEPEPVNVDGWSGVKRLLTTFVRDLNEHLAANFGDEAADFAMRLGAPVEDADTPTRQAVHHSCFCDRCRCVSRLCEVADLHSKTIVGPRHRCLGCPNYDLCSSPACIGSKDDFHERSHAFELIPTPVSSGLRCPYARTPDAPSTAPVAPKTAEVQHAATCDLCRCSITGIRHKCTPLRSCCTC